MPDSERGPRGRLLRQQAQSEALVVEWEKKAMLAVKAGNDALAQQALLRMFEVAHEAAAYGREAAALAAATGGAAASIAVPTTFRVVDEPMPPVDLVRALHALKGKMGVADRRPRSDDTTLDDLVRELVAHADKKKRGRH